MKKFFKERAFVGILLLAFVAVTAIVGVLAFNKKSKDLVDLNEPTSAEKTTTNYSVVNNEPETSEKQTQEEKPVSSITVTKNTEKQTKATSKTAGVGANTRTLKFGKDSKLVWPVQGKVLLEYNMDNTIYFPTLNEYKCNPAVILQADKGMEVKAAVTGVVKEVKANEEIGNYVVMDIGDGHEITYGQLNTTNLAVGQTVEKEQVIGTIAKPTKYYVTEGYNLYLKLTKNGEPIDPLDYLDYK